MKISGFCLSTVVCFFFFKQKTAYEMRISDWSSDVCSSDLWSRLTRRTTSRQVTCSALRRPVNAVKSISATSASETQRPSDSSQIAWGYLIGDQASSSMLAIEIGRASCRERVCQYV